MALLRVFLLELDTGNQGVSSPALPPSPLPYLSARVGPLELANALAACVLSARLTSKHRQWAAQQLVLALAATGRDSPNRPQTCSDLAGDLRKCPLKRLEGHYNKVRDCNLIRTEAEVCCFCFDLTEIKFEMNRLRRFLVCLFLFQKILSLDVIKSGTNHY